jgi:hypothetical protein
VLLWLNIDKRQVWIANLEAETAANNASIGNNPQRFKARAIVFLSLGMRTQAAIPQSGNGYGRLDNGVAETATDLASCEYKP